jgi:hypothetical protein
VIDSASIISSLATATAIVALVVVLERQITKAICGAKVIAAECGLKKIPILEI